MRFAELTYTKQEVEEDAIHYLTTQLYAPVYASKVKQFIKDDMADFKDYYDNNQYVFQQLYYDEYVTGYEENDDEPLPIFDFAKLHEDLADDFQYFGMDDEQISHYLRMLEVEFRKNAYFSHTEPYFLGEESVMAATVAGYARNPITSVYSMVREWAMALHLKKLHPQQMRKFGYVYQSIREQFKGEERLRRLVEFRDKYKITIQTIGLLRTIHSSIFAYSYLYLKAVLSGETKDIYHEILEMSSSQIYLLMQGESINSIDFPIVRKALDELSGGRYKELLTAAGTIDWDALYDFAMDVIYSAGGLVNLKALSFDGVSPKTIQAFWNKSGNMQSMLKILRRLVMDNSDPIFNSLIEMCEYRLGRPDDKAQKKMERFLEYNRRLMQARAYELTRPRSMAQEFVALFPSVFYVYFQWHHNFRNVWPKYPTLAARKKEEPILQQRRQAEATLVNKINTYENDNKLKDRLRQQQKAAQNEGDTINKKRAEELSKNNSNQMRFVLGQQDKVSATERNADKAKELERQLSVNERNQQKSR